MASLEKAPSSSLRPPPLATLEKAPRDPPFFLGPQDLGKEPARPYKNTQSLPAPSKEPPQDLPTPPTATNPAPSARKPACATPALFATGPKHPPAPPSDLAISLLASPFSHYPYPPAKEESDDKMASWLAPPAPTPPILGTLAKFL